MKYIGSKGVSVDLQPWFSSGYSFTKLHLFEEIGGNLSGGTMDLLCAGTEEALDLITNQSTGTLIIERSDGWVREIPIYITSKKYLLNSLTIAFTCISDKDFFTKLISSEWETISDVIEAVYPGNIDIRCDSDVARDVKIPQLSESNYKLLTRLAKGWKRDSIFALGWEGFMIKDVIGVSSAGNKEPDIIVGAKLNINQTSAYNLNYDKRLYQEGLDSWDDRDEADSNNLSGIIYYNQYSLVGKDYSQVILNTRHNDRYTRSDLYTSFQAVSHDIPDYKIGDVVSYVPENKEVTLPFKLFLVRSNELFISLEGSKIKDVNGLHFSWTTKFIGLTEDGGILPTTEPERS